MLQLSYVPMNRQYIRMKVGSRSIAEHISVYLHKFLSVPENVIMHMVRIMTQNIIM